MTLSDVKPGSREPAPPAIHDSLHHSATSSAPAAPPTIASLTMGNVLESANEDEAATPDATRNPLWLIAWGMACLFGVMATIIALG